MTGTVYVRHTGRTWHLATVDGAGEPVPYALCQRTRVLERWFHVYRLRPPGWVCRRCEREAAR